MKHWRRWLAGSLLAALCGAILVIDFGTLSLPQSIGVVACVALLTLKIAQVGASEGRG